MPWSVFLRAHWKALAVSSGPEPLHIDQVWELEYLAAYLMEWVIGDCPRLNQADKEWLIRELTPRWIQQSTQLILGTRPGLVGVAVRALNSGFGVGEKAVHDHYRRVRTRYDMLLASSVRTAQLRAESDLSVILVGFVQRLRFPDGRERPLPRTFTQEKLEWLGHAMVEVANIVERLL